MEEVVVVLDIAPVHSGIESVVCEEEFLEAEILRLAPYSPIERVWSPVKCKLKTLMAEQVNVLISGDTIGSLTQSEFRLRNLERYADEAMTSVSSELEFR